MSEQKERVPKGDRALFALSGLVAAAVGLAVAELSTSVNRAWRSPVEVVAEVVIDRAPQSITHFGIELFGRNDKKALVIGILVTLTIVGLVVGALSRRRPVVGDIAFGAFAVVGAGAALQVANAPLSAVIPSLIAGGLGAVTLRFLRARLLNVEAARAEKPVSDETTGQPMAEPVGGTSRRTFLALTGAMVALAGVAAAGGRALRDRFSAADSRNNLVLPAPDETAPPITDAYSVDVEGMTPFRTSNADFYRIDTALTVPQVPVEGWELEVKGMVDESLRLTFDELVAFGLVEADVTMTCVSNRVGGELIGNARWLGVPVQRLLDEVGVDPEADQLVGRSVDGYTCGFPVSAVGDGRTCLVAVGMNGEPLPLEHGFPARLVTAGLYGYISATKWLTEIELTTFDAFDSYWVPRGYADRAPIKTECRIDVPRTGEPVTAGPQSIAGVAWAQTRGIQKVEVKVDDGPWQEAELADALTDETWRQWRIDWDAQPGSPRIMCRATDGDGELMTEERSEPLPDGATGWQSKLVIVSAA
ncbi:MAG: molybdopterin-dependent oxidoreductase [Acidimicrobiales bacterium]